MIKSILDISTGHMPSTSPDFGDVRHIEHEYGFVAFVTDPKMTPEWLKPIMLKALHYNCVLINFDADAEKSSQFPIYDW